ncbi:diacylglycerol/lipid kinase family protein [Kineococcus aurantiacus]|uniref:Diacylglycerol kinase family enzyme n=1 Tax=Kineococcus aurantiacus TaxID=37633 RepID=A0A7Y9DKS5_9ACTN|nr:diacylglycerol kinase family protein [Kineococcus aurantiacus]NYD22420.1 diacylglycerol kinase family enzyme [Kineococcus aurantiacus]
MTVADLLDTGVLAVFLALAALVAFSLLLRERRTTRRLRTQQVPPAAPAAPAAGAPRRRAAIVVNPTKFTGLDEHSLRRRQAYVAAVFRSHGWEDPLWLETTPTEHGRQQARDAVAQGVDIVLAAGGDGTVRSVAEGLAGTSTPMALLPAGTGNLLARNLDVPHTDLAAALDLVFSEEDVRVDVGWLEVDRSGRDAEPERHLFLVMAGLGFDAAMMAGVEDRLKQRLGYGAYVVSGARALWGPQAKVQVSVDGQAPAPVRTRAVIVGNCGKLTKQLVLMPDAEIDDGYLDAVVLSPRGGIGWGEVAWAIATRDRRGQRRVRHLRGKRFEVTCQEPQEVELDGDPIGPAHRVTLTVDPGVLRVRCPPLRAGAHAAPR